MLVSYHQRDDGKYNELTEFKNSLKFKNRHHAKVILDLKKKTILKNELNSNASFNDMLEFYKKVIGSTLLDYLPS
jgi:hypothetical protein